MGESSRISVLIFTLVANEVLGNYYHPYKTEEPIYTPQHFYPQYEKPEVRLHKLCSWNVLEWEDQIIKDVSNSKTDDLKYVFRFYRNISFYRQL